MPFPRPGTTAATLGGSNQHRNTVTPHFHPERRVPLRRELSTSPNEDEEPRWGTSPLSPHPQLRVVGTSGLWPASEADATERGLLGHSRPQSVPVLRPRLVAGGGCRCPVVHLHGVGMEITHISMVTLAIVSTSGVLSSRWEGLENTRLQGGWSRKVHGSQQSPPSLGAEGTRPHTTENGSRDRGPDALSAHRLRDASRSAEASVALRSQTGLQPSSSVRRT